MNTLEDQIQDQLDAIGPRAHLVAVCDIAELDEELRNAVRERFAGDTFPLLRDPAWSALHPYSPVLLGAASADSRGHTKLLGTFLGSLRNALHGWIVSTVAPERLVDHFAQANVARGPDGAAYLLRYYDPWVLPVLYQEAPREWWRAFIGPVASWWVPKGDTKVLRWGKVPGPGDSNPTSLSPLMIDQALWRELTGDSLPHRLLSSVETQAPDLFDNPCRGVRLARIEILVSNARKAGLSTHDDLHDYVFLSLAQGAANLAADRCWLTAMRAAVAGEGRLGDLYSAACRRQA
ncbi:DUF4123 domain-containing protein [Pseudomonas sp. NyZ201]|uniref:DUF4123 domain-containing protein n=1 Tax=Pseudomonas sp. NyZ201 TaxID=3409857 RepID=UPI003CF52FDB